MTTLDSLGQGATVTITLPLPNACLHPNARACWQQRMRSTKRARAGACLAAYQYRPRQPAKRLTIQPVFYLARKRDGDGLVAWLKAYLDGLQDAKLIENDSGITVLPPKVVPRVPLMDRRVELQILSAEWE